MDRTERLLVWRAVEVALDLPGPGLGAGVVVSGHHPPGLEQLDHTDTRELCGELVEPGGVNRE